MASVSTNQRNGYKTVHLTDANGVRRTLSLGKVPLRDARVVAAHIQVLVDARQLGRPVLADA